jgi:hypothetical protein
MDDRLYEIHNSLNIHNFIGYGTMFRRCECGAVQMLHPIHDDTGGRSDWVNCSIFGEMVVEEDLFEFFCHKFANGKCLDWVKFGG